MRGVASQNDARRIRRLPVATSAAFLPRKISENCSICMSAIADSAVGWLLALDKHGLVASREKVSPQPMPRVEPGRIGTLKPLHTRDKIVCRRLQQEMIVIIHQHVAVHHKASPFADLPKSRQEVLPILIVQENRLAPIAPAQQMIEGALILDACPTRHLLF